MLKDPVAKTILSHSPPAPRKQYLSRSLDIAESKLTQLANASTSSSSAQTQQEQERKQKLAQEEAAKSMVKTVKFEKPSEEEVYENSSLFEAVPVAPEPAANVNSVLANLIKSLPMPVSNKDTNVTRTERVKVKVFVPEGPFLAVEVPKVATVGEVIWSSIQLYDEEKRQPPLVQLTRAYLLKMAEEDGTPEDMVLKYTDKFFNFGQYFVLVPNPSYEGAGSSGTIRGAALSRDSSQKMDSPNASKDSKAARKGMGTFRGGRKPGVPTSVGSADESDLGKFLKVKMPDGTHTTVQLQETALVSELLEKCCSKRKFDPDQFHLEFIEDQEEVPETLTVLQLKDRQVELVANSAVAGLDTYMSDTKAMQYEVFRVVKIKAGFNAKKQERMLGIDFDRISNQMPEEALQAKSGFGKTVDVIRGRGAGVKNDYWLMTDLVEVTQDPEKTKQFVLTLKDATNREKVLTYRYEAETRKVTEQIVGKLSRLLELNNKFKH